jgi:hypothetical protein
VSDIPNENIVENVEGDDEIGRRSQSRNRRRIIVDDVEGLEKC